MLDADDLKGIRQIYFLVAEGDGLSLRENFETTFDESSKCSRLPSIYDIRRQQRPKYSFLGSFFHLSIRSVSAKRVTSRECCKANCALRPPLGQMTD
jgi:hypothetical protein